MTFLYQTIIYKPILNILVYLYNTVAFQDLGIAIILITILLRLVLYPVYKKGIVYQIAMQRLQPHLNRIKEEHKNDIQKQSTAMMAAYKENNLNPFSGILLLIVQLPLLIALYHIFLRIFTPEIFSGLYSFITRPEVLNTEFLGLINLQNRSIVLVLLAAAAQYWQTKLTMPKIEPGAKLSTAESISRQMVFLGPIITVVIFYGLPAAVGLYWAASSLIGIAQHYLITYQLRNVQLGNTNKKTS